MNDAVILILNDRAHLDAAYKHARHYTGWAIDLNARLEAHRTGRGARLMQVITDAGITWQLARTWPGGRDLERAIKNRHNAPRICPLCSPRPQPVKTGQCAIAAAVSGPSPVLPHPARLTPHERGLRMAGLFLTQRAGWTADQLTAAFAYTTRPYLEAPRHTPAQEEAFGVFTQTVTSRITQLSAPDSVDALGGYQ